MNVARKSVIEDDHTVDANVLNTENGRIYRLKKPLVANPDREEELLKLKYDISVLVVQRICDSLGCTPEEYGKVYDSEAHGQMLVEIMQAMAPHIDAEVTRALDITVSCYNGHTVIKRGKKKHWITLEPGESINLNPKETTL